MKRDPRIGDRVAALRISRGRRAYEVFGVVTNEDVRWPRVHWTARRTAAGLEPADLYSDANPATVVGEWEGHCEDGDTCWCVPEIVGELVIHNHESEES